MESFIIKKIRMTQYGPQIINNLDSLKMEGKGPRMTWIYPSQPNSDFPRNWLIWYFRFIYVKVRKNPTLFMKKNIDGCNMEQKGPKTMQICHKFNFLQNWFIKIFTIFCMKLMVICDEKFRGSFFEEKSG